MVVVDSTVLLLLLQPGAGGPAGVTEPAARVDFLVSELERTSTTILIPTPVLSEVLVRASAATAVEILEELHRNAAFRILPFDERAALEVADMSRRFLSRGDKPHSREATYAKLKYDRQIVAIAKVAKATRIYSDDKGLQSTAQQERIPVVGLKDLPLPPKLEQHEMGLFDAHPADDE
jgi:predicted nucleic acid-binding protein